MKSTVSLICLLMLTACGTAPMSLLEGEPYHRTHLNRYPVNIVAVNGKFSTQHPRQVYAGVSTIIVEAAPVGGMRVAKQQALAFKAQPCTRYYLAAERETSLSQDWKLVVDHTEPVGGCNPDEEIEKSKREGIPLADIVKSKSATK
ncbi:MAG: hypothetical protein JNM76_16735 [Betaproteobacteria bacterium]|nr:hypothetical protein [Betaproteobacteria bacterium]